MGGAGGDGGGGGVCFVVVGGGVVTVVVGGGGGGCDIEVGSGGGGGGAEGGDTHELVNLTALKLSLYQLSHPSMIFFAEFQRVHYKFHQKYLTHTLKDVYFVEEWRLKGSRIYEPVSVFETPPWYILGHCNIIKGGPPGVNYYITPPRDS